MTMWLPIHDSTETQTDKRTFLEVWFIPVSSVALKAEEELDELRAGHLRNLPLKEEDVEL